MKIRTDFVSNSSSSSFVLFGFVMSVDEFIRQFYANDKSTLTEYENGDNDLYEFIDPIMSKLEDAGLGIELLGYDSIDEVVVGADPNTMKNTETLNQFRKRIHDQLKCFNFKVPKTKLEFYSGAIEPSGLSYVGDNG